MLPRQREFCRFYLQGMTASAAAIAAGYAKSTAERNAASILQNPAVMAKLERMRQVREAPFHVAGQAALEGFTFSVMTEKDVRLKAAASRQVLAWMSAMKQLGPSAQEVEMIDALLRQETQINVDIDTDNQTDKFLGANPKTASDQAGPLIPEHDALDDGTPAFDLRQAPRKPLPPKVEPISIKVFNYLDPEDGQTPVDRHGRPLQPGPLLAGPGSPGWRKE